MTDAPLPPPSDYAPRLHGLDPQRLRGPNYRLHWLSWTVCLLTVGSFFYLHVTGSQSLTLQPVGRYVYDYHRQERIGFPYPFWIHHEYGVHHEDTQWEPESFKASSTTTEFWVLGLVFDGAFFLFAVTLLTFGVEMLYRWRKRIRRRWRHIGSRLTAQPDAQDGAPDDTAWDESKRS